MAASSSMFVNPANIQSLVTVKLTKDNYLLWKTQVVPYLRGQRIFGFVDGSNPPPPITIPNPETATSSDTTAEIPNPKLTTWYLQDQVVLSTSVSSLSEGILAQMKMKSFADTLAAIGQPLLDQEFTAYLLGGLDTTYDAIVTSISTRIDQMPTEEMFSHLLNFELRLEQHNSTLEATVGSANVATRQDLRSRDRKQHQYQRSSHLQYRGRGRHPRGRGNQFSSSGQFPPSQSNNPRPTC
ncbi:hypothetical protein F0562_013599 [Nyssa sinensis]|uniref:Retrotransposon Copia-like N-terminal domain-containing protein n=1 Tax=Nyssa sinensis TaxID=561372 RepID=A0A5J4ZKL8_9ASTE|nr:hypothetical protein F0562_013599 [Nyssa sinensis]